MIGVGRPTARLYSRWSLVAAALLLCPNQASAHLVSTRFGELYSGLLHPLTTLAHVVPWLGLGLLGGVQAPKTARWAPWVLPLCAALGALAGSSLAPSTWVTHANLASFVVLGALVALGVELPARGFVALTAVVGLSHGYENGAPALSGGALILYVTGVALAAHLLITIVSGFAQAARTRARWGAIALRAAGSWIVAVGLIFGGFTLMTPS